MKTFTIEEANAALPLVRAIVADLVHLSQEVTERRQRVNYLLSNRVPNENDPYWQELAAIEASLEQDSLQLRGYVDELRQLGIEPKSAVDGVVDFPSRLDGRNVYLCWKLGESEVLHWHEINDGFQGRHPLTADAGTSGDFFSSGDSTAC
jgi:hypothetical protein